MTTFSKCGTTKLEYLVKVTKLTSPVSSLERVPTLRAWLAKSQAMAERQEIPASPHHRVTRLESRRSPRSCGN